MLWENGEKWTKKKKMRKGFAYDWSSVFSFFSLEVNIQQKNVDRHSKQN